MKKMDHKKKCKKSEFGKLWKLCIDFELDFLFVNKKFGMKIKMNLLLLLFVIYY